MRVYLTILSSLSVLPCERGTHGFLDVNFLTYMQELCEMKKSLSVEVEQLRSVSNAPIMCHILVYLGKFYFE